MDSRAAEIRISQEDGEPVRLTVDGVGVDVPDGDEPAEVGLDLVAQEARRAGETVPAVLDDERDVLHWRVLVHPDGSVSDDLAPLPAPAAPPRRGFPVRRAMPAVVLAAALALAGISYATRAPSGPVGGSTAPTTSAVAIQAIQPPADTTAAEVPPSVAAVPPSAAAPVPSAAPTSVPRARAVPVPTRAAPAPTRAVPAPPRRTSAPAVVRAPAPTLSDAAGRCLTAAGGGVTSAACSGSSTQAWTAGGGQLRNGGKCLAFGNGLSLAPCGGAATQGWAANATTTTNTGMCLENVGGRPVLTQCGTGRALVLTRP